MEEGTFEVDPEMQEYTSILVLPTLGRGEEAHRWNYAVTDANDLAIQIESALSDQAGELSKP
jgi:hypothetical protein